MNARVGSEGPHIHHARRYGLLRAEVVRVYVTIGSEMTRPKKIATAFPSVLETAKRLGVSKHDAMVLSEMAKLSEKTGEFIIPGIGRLVRVERKARAGRKSAMIKIPAKKVVSFRVAKAAKDEGVLKTV